MADANQSYNFICPSCSGKFSIQLDRIPPVQARFRCPHCSEPMDFPSREEARVSFQVHAQAEASAEAPAARAADPGPAKPAEADNRSGAALSKGKRFRVEKPGFESDVFDREGIRNLIRTREILETDRIRVDDSGPVRAGRLPYLKSLFSLARDQRIQAPARCRTHTEKVAFFRCHDSGRPLCERCAPEKKFGSATIRVCDHCGGNVIDLASP